MIVLPSPITITYYHVIISLKLALLAMLKEYYNRSCALVDWRNGRHIVSSDQ